MTNEGRYRQTEGRLWRSLGVTPTEQRVHLDRTGVTVRVQEVGEGPAVVFVHGGAIGGTSWASLVARLPDFRCIVLDRPGCGLSDPLVSNFEDVDELGTFADGLIVDVLDGMGLDRAYVASTSFGGYIALRSVAAHPDRVGRMIEFGFPIGAPIERVPVSMRLATVPMLGRLVATLPPTEWAVRAMLRNIGLGQALAAGRVTQEMIDWNLSLLRDTDTMRNELEVGPRIITPLKGMNVGLLLPASLLARIGTPVHFVWGEEDPFGGADTARRFVAHLPNAALELVPGAGHAVWMDDPDRAAAATRTFLGE